MGKDAPPSSAGSTAAGKVFLFSETKLLVSTILAFTLVIAIWNFQPYYHNLLSYSCHCSSSSTSAAITTTSLAVALNATSILSSKTKQLLPRRQNVHPNKREFAAYGNAAALFVQMGAYRGGASSFAVVGLASKPIHVYGRPWYRCEWISSNGTSTKSKSLKILPDWGYGRVYTVVVVNCTFPSNPNADNSGGKLLVSAYYGLNPRKFEKFVALEESPGSYSDSRFVAPYPYDYLYCGSSLYGTLNPNRFREWMAYHAWFFGGRSHFVFHDAGGVSPEIRAVLEPWVRAGRVTIQDIRAQEQFDGYYYNQFLVVNDCLHRYRFSANWTFYFDVDEYIYLPEKNSSLESVLKEFEHYTQFTIEQNPMSSELCLNDSTQNYSRQWGFEKLMFRDSREKIRRDRKYAIQAKNAYATGVHMSENVIGKTLHDTETKIRYYHYHNSIQVEKELCKIFLPPSAKKTVTWHNKRPYKYDDSMKKMADTVKQFERQALGNTQLS
ncbi:hypothetical protein V2J09_021355 [Rumex salicifolius]